MTESLLFETEARDAQVRKPSYFSGISEDFGPEQKLRLHESSSSVDVFRFRGLRIQSSRPLLRFIELKTWVDMEITWILFFRPDFLDF